MKKVGPLLLLIYIALVLSITSQKQEEVTSNLEVLSATSFSEVDQKVKSLTQQFTAKELLIVVDIDNTLLTSSTDLGGDIWYQWQRGKLTVKPSPEQKVPCLFEDAIGLLYELNPMELTESMVPDVINSWQEQDISLFALTSRAPKYRAATERELTRHGIDLSKTCIRPKGEELPVYRMTLEREMSYMQGVMMTTGMNKGKMLQWMLDKTNRTYQAIVFVDDSKKNIDDMEKAFTNVPIDMNIFYYQKIEEERINANGGVVLSQDQADSMYVQWQELNQTLLQLFPSRGVNGNCLGN